MANNEQNLPAYMEMPLTKTGEVQLETFRDAFMLCDWVCKAGFAPKGKDTPQKVFIAAQMGASLGLTFWASLTNVMVVNGMPTIWGDAMLALIQDHFDVQADSHKVKSLEYFSEFLSGQLPNEDATAWCIAKRAGVGLDVEEIFPDVGWAGVVNCDPVVLERAGWSVASFSVWDAKKAGLWSKSGPWSSYPKRMMQMRARSIALRNGWADVLKGFRAHEELQGTAVEVADESRQLDLRGEDRTTTAADYTDAELDEQAPAKPGPAAGLDFGQDKPQAGETETPDPGVGGSKGQTEIVEPRAPGALENDPLAPKNLVAGKMEPPKPYEGPKTREAGPVTQDGWLEEGDVEEVEEAEGMPINSMGPLEEEEHGPDCQCDTCLDMRRGAGSQAPQAPLTPSERKAADLDEIKYAYWEKIWDKVGSTHQVVVRFKAYNEHMRDLSGEDELTWYTRALNYIDGHIDNVNRWHAHQQNAKNARDEDTARRVAQGPTDEHAPAEKAVAAAHQQGLTMEAKDSAGSPEATIAQAGEPSRKVYTREMLEVDERQEEDDPDFDPLRYINVKSKRGKGVKAYYERHLDKMVEVLSHPTVDWSEEILGPHRAKWNSVALTKAMPFILDEKAREAQYAKFPAGHTTSQDGPSGSQADEFRMRGLKDKIRSYENHDPRLFQKVIDKLKVSKNPMTLRGAEDLLDALTEEWQKANS